VPRLLPRKKRFGPDDVVVAWQSFAADVDGRPYTITPKMTLRGDHPVVVAHPWYFANAVAEPTEHQPEFHRPAPPIPDEEAAECVTAFQVGFGGPKVVKGQTLRKDDPLVVAHPDFFRTVGQRLG
jgi:hypothetical protein